MFQLYETKGYYKVNMDKKIVRKYKKPTGMPLIVLALLILIIIDIIRKLTK